MQRVKHSINSRFINLHFSFAARASLFQGGHRHLFIKLNSFGARQLPLWLCFQVGCDKIGREEAFSSLI